MVLLDAGMGQPMGLPASNTDWPGRELLSVEEVNTNIFLSIVGLSIKLMPLRRVIGDRGTWGTLSAAMVKWPCTNRNLMSEAMRGANAWVFCVLGAEVLVLRLFDSNPLTL